MELRSIDVFRSELRERHCVDRNGSVGGGRPEDEALLIGRQGGRGKVRLGGLLAAQVPSLGEEVKGITPPLFPWRGFVVPDEATKSEECHTLSAIAAVRLEGHE
jgi:hypothetical protein